MSASIPRTQEGRLQKSRSQVSPRAARREEAGIALLLAALALPFGWGIEWTHGQRARDAAAAQDWPTTPGVITESSRVMGSSSKLLPSARVRYTFRVDGRTYPGEDVNLDVAALETEEAHEVLARYPVGREVVVHYDPERPFEASTLEAIELDGWDHLFLGMGWGLRWGGAALAVLAAGLYRASRPSSSAP